jgi:isoaspartyl peptidase/L-asparaginase-like protein (Ntn-hydrolase superfamily)
VRLMEDSPLFNAGKGAVFTSEGTNELDASIMDGRSRDAGAVAGVKRVKNPITLARMVMEHSPHVMMAREGAEHFADEERVRSSSITARDAQLTLTDLLFILLVQRQADATDYIHNSEEAVSVLKVENPQPASRGSTRNQPAH